MDLIRKEEARAMLGISMNTLDKLIREGKLPAYRVTDHAIRLDREDVTGYLASRKIQPPPAPAARWKRPPAPVSGCEYYPGMKVV